MELVYIKLFVDYLDAIEPLGDVERGRLFTALLQYARTGAAPQLTGSERFIFPMMRAQLDRDAAELREKSEKNSNNGKKGGRPRKSNETEKSERFSEKRPVFSESEKSKDNRIKTIDKDKDKDKEERVKAPARGRFTPPSIEEVEAYCQDQACDVDAERFVDFYESKGWKVGSQPMKDWKAAIRNWARRDRQNAKQTGADRNAWMDEYIT